MGDEVTQAAAATDAKIIVVMPAYNAARTLADTIARFPPDFANEIILVDDRSRDDTVEVAKRLGESINLVTIPHPHNVGYGGNQKTCYMEALRRGADVIVMVHPDGQYDPTFLPEIVKPILRGESDVVLGSRMLVPGHARMGGMPWWKRVANGALTGLENLVFRRHLSEYHTGYRAFSRRFLQTVPFLRNSRDFVFDSEMLAQAVAFNFSIAEIPVDTKYFPEASSVSFRGSTVYGLKTLWVLVRFALHRSGIVRSPIFLP
jgi:glycosyltransferase involved in cell wall biosynthesis